MLSEPRSSKTKTAIFAAITSVGALIFLEAFASWALMLRMRLSNSETFTKYEPTYFSLLNIPYKAVVGFRYQQPLELRIEGDPSPANQHDAELGYKHIPGKYRVTFSRRTRGSSEWEHLQINETFTNEGTRWTGECEPTSKSNVYIFGDSWVAGNGVNDEQTFAFLLQQARKDMCVKLLAVGGFGMTQSFIQFQRVLNQITPNDLIILGYADYLDERTVLTPSRLRDVRDWYKSHDEAEERVMLPKATLDPQGAIAISYVQQRCDENGGYCDQPDPPKEETSRITATLINQIADQSSAPVYLLHFSGTKQNPIFGLLRSSIHIISALKEDFPYVIKDDILGFDPHPGPWWHYAISRKLIETFATASPSTQSDLRHVFQTR